MERLFGAIPAVLDGLGHKAEIEEAMVFAAWKRCAGELLCERTAALEFFEDRLIVAVTDETWRRHLEDLSPQMLVKLNHYVGQGTVTFIEFVIDAAAVGRSNKPEIPGTNDSSKPIAVAPSLARAAGAIADPSLREQFISTAASYLARQNAAK